MEATPKEILICRDTKGQEPFSLWLKSLKDVRAVGIILRRIRRMSDGNFGDVESVGEGVSELRIDFGPGYRIYFGRLGDKVHIISAGQKKTQRGDIRAAKGFWKIYGKT